MRSAALIFMSCSALLAQVPNPTQSPIANPNNGGQPTPIYRVTVVSRTTKAINYNHRNGTTHIDFRGTDLMPEARGNASVDSKMGSTKIDTHLDHMTPPSQFGPEYMTYVLWAITPEGRATNLGEVVLEGNHANLLSTTDLQSFGLIVTAEPYFSVTQPSDVVVAENFINNQTSGTIEQVDAKYELLQRGQYVMNRTDYKPVKVDPKGPLQLGEAENAVQIARMAGAEQYANDTFSKAVLDLQNAEDFLNGKNHDRKRSETEAREAAQMAEDARIITYRKIREQEIADDKARTQQAEAQRQAAEQAKMDADAAAAKAAQDRAAAEEQQRLAQQQAEQARMNAEAAEKARQAAEQQRQEADAERTQLRERLRQQLSAVLETQETARGLIVNISDVLFDFNKYTLKPEAREKMAKVSGILLAYPGLKIQLEGHTDSIGTDDYNMKLSDERANAVRDYLVQQGVLAESVTAVGLGKENPVASNDTEAGRQRNRRVDMVVSGGGIGGTGGPANGVPPPTPAPQQ